MLQIGTYHTLQIARATKVGLYLVNETEEVLLPNKYVPADYHIGDDLTVLSIWITKNVRLPRHLSLILRLMNLRC